MTPNATTAPVKVAEFRGELDWLSKCFAGLRGCTRFEKQANGLIVSRCVMRVIDMRDRVKRAAPRDLERATNLIEHVRSYLAENPELRDWLNENA